MSWAKEEWKQDLSPLVLTNIEELEKEGANWKKLNHQQQLQLERLEAALEKQNQITAKEKATSAELNRHIQDMSNNFFELENKYEKAGKELKGKNKKIALLEEQLQKAKQTLKSDSNRVAELESEINKKQKKLDETAREMNNLFLRIKKYEQEDATQNEVQQDDGSSEVEVKASTARSLTEMLKKENDGLVKENEEIKRQKSQMKRFLEEKEREIDRMSEKLSKSRSELDTTLRALKEIEGIAEKLRAELAEKETKIACLISDRDALKRENNKLNKELDHLRFQSEAERHDYISLTKEFERNQKVIKSLENRLESKTILLKEKQIRPDALEARISSEISSIIKHPSLENEKNKQAGSSAKKQEQPIGLASEANPGVRKEMECGLQSENQRLNSSNKFPITKSLDDSSKILEKEQLQSKTQDCEASKLETQINEIEELKQKFERLNNSNKDIKTDFDTQHVLEEQYKICQYEPGTEENNSEKTKRQDWFGENANEWIDYFLQKLVDEMKEIENKADDCNQASETNATWPADCAKDRIDVEQLFQKARELLEALYDMALNFRKTEIEIKKRLFRGKVKTTVLHDKIGSQCPKKITDENPTKKPSVDTQRETQKENKDETSQNDRISRNDPISSQTHTEMRDMSCQTSETAPEVEINEDSTCCERVDMSWDDYPENTAFAAYRADVDAIVEQLNREKEFLLRKKEELQEMKREQEASNRRKRSELATYIQSYLRSNVSEESDEDISRDTSIPKNVIVMSADEVVDIMRELLRENNDELEKIIKAANYTNTCQEANLQPTQASELSERKDATEEESKYRSLGKNAISDLETMKHKIEDIQKTVKRFVASISSSCRKQDTIRSQINLLDEELREKTSLYEVKCRDFSDLAQTASDKETHLLSRVNALACEKEQINRELREVFESLKEKELELVANTRQLKHIQAKHDKIEHDLQSRIASLQHENENLWHDYKEASEKAEQSGLECKGVVDQLTNARGYLLNLFESLSNIDDGLQQARDMHLYE